MANAITKILDNAPDLDLDLDSPKPGPTYETVLQVDQISLRWKMKCERRFGSLEDSPLFNRQMEMFENDPTH
jgi:hypothetical protein